MDMMQQNTFTLGVNYWPRKKAMYWWKDFDRAEVETEFAEIAALKLQVVRIFLFWEDFQPVPNRVSDRALADLGSVLDVARDVGIKVMPTFFTGHMSGINWWPTWALTDEEEPGGIPRIANGEYTTRRSL
jgi:endo-1,4-beta-mannosidase